MIPYHASHSAPSPSRSSGCTVAPFAQLARWRLCPSWLGTHSRGLWATWPPALGRTVRSHHCNRYKWYAKDVPVAFWRPPRVAGGNALRSLSLFPRNNPSIFCQIHLIYIACFPQQQPNVFFIMQHEQGSFRYLVV